MKFPVIGGVVFLLSGVGVLAALTMFNGDGKKPTPDTSSAVASSTADVTAPETLVFHVPDMSCDVVCSPKVRKTLAAIPGVEDVETNIDDHTATIVASAGFDESKALAALSKAGYPAQRATN